MKTHLSIMVILVLLMTCNPSAANIAPSSALQREAAELQTQDTSYIEGVLHVEKNGRISIRYSGGETIFQVKGGLKKEEIAQLRKIEGALVKFRITKGVLDFKFFDPKNERIFDEVLGMGD